MYSFLEGETKPQQVAKTKTFFTKKSTRFTVSSSLISSLKAKHRINDEKREKALGEINDESKRGQRLKKTQMCRSVNSRNKCPHGQKCRYAHKESELEIAECAFGSGCRLVQYRNNVYHSIGSRICQFIHPKENKDSYFSRTKRNFKKQEESLKPVTKRMSVKFEQRHSSDICDKILTHKPGVLKVYREIVNDVLQMLIDVGEQKIEIEVI